MTDIQLSDLPALVSADRLAAELPSKDICILDASWYLPAENRDAHAEFEQGHIPGASFFDIDAVSAHDTDLPHMLPDEAAFAAAVNRLGVDNHSRVVIYDGFGVMSAARVWWMFRVFGHEQVAVLNGGMRAWQAAGFELESGPVSKPKEGAFEARFNPGLVRTMADVQACLGGQGEQIVDARPAGRFKGVDPEPRAGLRSGHIPGSFNVPFTDLLVPDSGEMLPEKVLRQRFLDAGLELTRPISSSCGSGVTACVLALGLFLLGRDDVAVYDGSWSEWGREGDWPVEAG